MITSYHRHNISHKYPINIPYISHIPSTGADQRCRGRRAAGRRCLRRGGAQDADAGGGGAEPRGGGGAERGARCRGGDGFAI